jgi:hypothetical protein
LLAIGGVTFFATAQDGEAINCSQKSLRPSNRLRSAPMTATTKKSERNIAADGALGSVRRSGLVVFFDVQLLHGVTGWQAGWLAAGCRLLLWQKNTYQR